MEIVLAGFVLGIMGSMHCIGMCGPIALSIPLGGASFGVKLGGSLLYNSGRAVTYGIMGGIFGLIGQGFQMVGFQQWISVVMGSVMVLSVIAPILFKKVSINDFGLNVSMS